MHTNTNTHTPTQIHTHIHQRRHIHTHANTNTYTNTHIFTYQHTHTHTNTHTYTHAPLAPPPHPLRCSKRNFQEESVDSSTRVFIVVKRYGAHLASSAVPTRQQHGFTFPVATRQAGMTGACCDSKGTRRGLECALPHTYACTPYTT